VREEPVYSDAKAVAEETMRRARHNLDLLVPRLQKLGFAFRYPKEVYRPPTKETLRDLNKFEKKVGPVPLSLRAWAEIVGTVNLMGTYPKLSYYATSPLSGTIGNVIRTGSIDIPDIQEMMKHMAMPPGFDASRLGSDILAKMKDGLNAMLGRQHEFLNQNPEFAGILKPPQNPEPEPPNMEVSEDDAVVSDPLVVWLDEISVDEYENWHESVDDDERDAYEGRFPLTFAPDIHHKSNYSGGGGYEILLPEAGADAPIFDAGEPVTFVEYLRDSFEWAGFPGLVDYEAARDDALIQQLREGFLPL
jgi:hypothetical protein